MVTLTNIQKIRLTVGDTSLDFQYLADETYQWILEQNGFGNAAVAALEMIINQIALSPQSVQTEDVKEVGPLVESLERRLKELRTKQNTRNYGFPMIVKSDRSNWNDIDSIYRNC